MCIVRRMVEVILMVSVALGCALLGCSAVHLAAKIPARDEETNEPLLADHRNQGREVDEGWSS